MYLDICISFESRQELGRVTYPNICVYTLANNGNSFSQNISLTIQNPPKTLTVLKGQLWSIQFEVTQQLDQPLLTFLVVMAAIVAHHNMICNMFSDLDSPC